MDAEIVSIGTELLMGEIVDTNSAYLASELALLGAQLHWVTEVGDDPERLYEALDRARRRSTVTLTTGGLGPTSDDLTREAIARVMGEQMEVKADLLEHLKAQFAGRGSPMPAANVKQAALIPSALSLPNPLGTAPGWWVERDARVIAAMPGPPRELEPMWANEVAPRLRKQYPGAAIATRTLKTLGISEGALNEIIAPLFDSANPRLGIYARSDGIHLRAIAAAPTEQQARALIAPMEDEIRRTVGYAVWGVDGETIESRVASMLLERGLTVGIYEWYTGGLATAALAEVLQSRTFLKGGIVVQSEESLAAQGIDAGLVGQAGGASAKVAEAMAVAARSRLRADVGVGIGDIAREASVTGVSVGTLYVGYALPGRHASVAIPSPTRRPHLRARAVSYALGELLRALSA